MGVRDFLQKHPGVIIAVALLALAAAVWAIARTSTRGRHLGGVYYLDLQSGDLFTGSIHDVPPIDAPTGGPNQGVRAHVFACEGCDTGQRFIAYITILSESARQAVAANQTGNIDVATFIEANTKVAPWPSTGDGAPAWTPLHSPQGEQITASYGKRCGDQRVIECHP